MAAVVRCWVAQSSPCSQLRKLLSPYLTPRTILAYFLWTWSCISVIKHASVYPCGMLAREVMDLFSTPPNLSSVISRSDARLDANPTCRASLWAHSARRDGTATVE